MKNLLLSFICLMLCTTLGVKAQVSVYNSTQLKSAFTEYGKIAEYQTAYDEASAEAATAKKNRDEQSRYIAKESYDSLLAKCRDVYKNFNSTTTPLFFATKKTVVLKDAVLDGDEGNFYDWYDANYATLESLSDDEVYALFAAVPGNEGFVESSSEEIHVYPLEPAKMKINGVEAKSTIVGNLSAYRNKYANSNFVFHYLGYDEYESGNSRYIDCYNDAAVYSNLTKFKNKISEIAASQEIVMQNAPRVIEYTENPLWTQYNQEYLTAAEKANNALTLLNSAKEYKDISIKGSFNTDAYISSYGGNIAGNGYTLTVSNANGALIGTSTASISGLCVSGAKIATTNNGNYKNCAVISGGITGYVGNTGVSYSSLPELAVAMSGVFGVDMTSSNVVLLPVTQNYKVYEYLYYAVDSKTVASKGYLNSRNGALVGIGKPTLGKNEFIILQSANTNTAITEDNVIEKTSDGYVCNSCRIVDGNEFFAPVGFVAKKMNYSRSFTANVWSSLVLPFSVSSSVLSKIGVTHVNVFSSFENKVATFASESSMEAYTPYIIRTSSTGVTFSNLVNVVVGKSSNKDSELRAIGGNGYFFGNLSTKQYAISQLSNNNAYRIFGFNSNNQMVRATGNSSFPTFRCYLKVKESEFASSSADSKIRVQFVDGFGKLIDEDAATAIDEVTSENFSVFGGNGEIIVNTEKASNVSVYTTGGKLVKVAEVVEGENSIAVAPGLYIVNNHKVIVR